MIAYTLFSGSTGNSIYIKNGADEILIDAGKSASAIEKALCALGSSLCRISAIFLTHEHGDHTGSLEMISKKHRIPVHICSLSYPRVAYHGSFVSQCATSHEVHDTVRVGSLTVSSFSVPHDSVQNVGYVIKADGGEVLGIATDIGHVTDEIREHLCGADYAIVESNHDKFLLVAGKYPEFLKHRILADTGHLSNEDSAELCLYLAKNGTKSITLAHLSRENNNPEIAHSVTRELLDRHGFEGVGVNVASPTDTVKVFERL